MFLPVMPENGMAEHGYNLLNTIFLRLEGLNKKNAILLIVLGVG